MVSVYLVSLSNKKYFKLKNIYLKDIECFEVIFLCILFESKKNFNNFKIEIEYF